MSSLTEARVNIPYKLLRFSFENPVFGPKIHLKLEEGATLDRARDTDHKERDFAKSARLYYSVLNTSKNIHEKVWAFGGLILQLNNAHAFRQAREFLRDQGPILLRGLPEDERYFLEADMKEKEGRIEVSERGYFPAIECFSAVEKILNKRGRERWGLEDQKAFSTAEHFLGKLKLELAIRGVNKEGNLQASREHLLIAIGMDMEIRGEGAEETVGYGFKELARNYLAEGNIKEADKALEEAREHFETYLKTTPKSNVLEGYQKLRIKIDSFKR